MEEMREFLDGRKTTYGDAVENMEAVADMVNGYLDGIAQRNGGKREITGADFAMIMVLSKVYRFAVTPMYSDNVKDVLGYAQIAADCVGDLMIDAESAKDYEAKKEARMKSPNIRIRPQTVQQEILADAAERGYPDVTLEEAVEVINKNARRVMPKINLAGEISDVSSEIIPTKRQQEQRDGVNKLTEGVGWSKAELRKRQAELPELNDR